MVDDEITSIKKDSLYIKDQLTTGPGTTSFFNLGKREQYLIEEGSLKVQGYNIEDSFILGHPVNAILGTSKLGSRISAGTIYRVLNYNNRYNDHLRDVNYIDTTNSTGTLDSTNFFFQTNAGSTLTSNIIATNGTTINWTSGKIVLSHYTRVLDNCDTIGNWTAGTGATTPVITGSWYVDDNRSISLGKDGITDTRFEYLDAITTTDLRGRALQVYFYVKNQTILNALETTSGTAMYIELGTGDTNTNRYYIQDQFDNGEFSVIVNLHNPDATTGTGANLRDVDTLRLSLKTGTIAGTFASGDIKMDRWIYYSQDTNLTVALSANNGDNWQTVTPNTTTNFTNTGTILKYRLTAGTRTEVESLWVEYSE